MGSRTIDPIDVHAQCLKVVFKGALVVQAEQAIFIGEHDLEAAREAR